MASACIPVRTSFSGPDAAPGLTLIGHSLPNYASDDLLPALRRTRHAAMDTAPGRTIPEAREALDWAIAQAPDVVVIDLGENDLRAGRAPATIRSLVGQALDRFATTRCLVWVDSVDRPSPLLPTWSTLAARFNRDLNELATARSNTHIAAWSDHAREQPGWFGTDQLHHTEAGQAAYAAFVAHEVDRFCGGPVTTTPAPSGAPIRAR